MEADSAYVATDSGFYVLDLSVPSSPALAGKLEVEEGPTVLQPLSDGLVAGVSQPLSGSGSGGQLELEVFDVSGPAHPILASRQALGEGVTSLAQTDPRAFGWWPTRAQSGLLALPLDGYTAQGATSWLDVWSVNPTGALYFLGALQQPEEQPQSLPPPPAQPVQAQPKSQAELASAPTLPAGTYGSPEIERAAVVGANLYTISQQGVMVNDLTSLSEVAWMPFAGSAP